MITSVRNIREFTHSTIVMMVEAAPGIAASHIYNYVRHEPNLVFMKERAGNAEGVPKNDVTTLLMKDRFELLLSKNQLRISDSLITYSPPDSDRPQTAESQVAKLELQMQNMRYEPLKRAHDYEDQRYHLTAKTGGMSDDLLISCLMAIYWSGRFWNSYDPRYAEAKQYIRQRMAG